MRHHEIQVNGIRMHYVTHGAGRPVLLLHGFPEYWAVWRSVMAQLGNDHLVIAPDLRGYNLTSRPGDVSAYHIRHLVEDVRGLLDALGIEQVVLAAQDWGAFVAWSFVLRHPERVERLITIDATHPALFNRALRENPAQQQASQYMLLFRAAGAAEAQFEADDYAWPRNAVFADARAHGAELSDEDIADWIATWQQPGAITAGLNYYRAAELGPPDGHGSPGGSNLVADLTPEQLHVRVPVLVLYALGDGYLLRSTFDGIEQLVPNITIIDIPGATHWLSLEKPATVAQHIRAFAAR